MRAIDGDVGAENSRAVSVRVRGAGIPRLRPTAPLAVPESRDFGSAATDRDGRPVRYSMSISRASVGSTFGSVTVSTPFFSVAETASSSTGSGSRTRSLSARWERSLRR